MSKVSEEIDDISLHNRNRYEWCNTKMHGSNSNCLQLQDELGFVLLGSARLSRRFAFLACCKQVEPGGTRQDLSDVIRPSFEANRFKIAGGCALSNQ